MNILGILAVYVRTPAGSTTGFKGRKDHASIFELDMVMINIKERGDNNPNNSNDNNNYKKIKISKFYKYHGEKEKFKSWLFQLII